MTGVLWVTSRAGKLVSRMDPLINQVVETIEIGFPTTGLAVTKDAVWVAGSKDPQLTRIHPKTNHVVTQINIAVGDNALLIANNGEDTV